MNTVRISPELKTKIQQVAQLYGISQSEVQRRALEAYCQQTLEHKQNSPFAKLIGVGEGEADLSTRVSEEFTGLLEDKHG